MEITEESLFECYSNEQGDDFGVAGYPETVKGLRENALMWADSDGYSEETLDFIKKSKPEEFLAFYTENWGCVLTKPGEAEYKDICKKVAERLSYGYGGVDIFWDEKLGMVTEIDSWEDPVTIDVYSNPYCYKSWKDCAQSWVIEQIIKDYIDKGKEFVNEYLGERNINFLVSEKLISESIVREFQTKEKTHGIKEVIFELGIKIDDLINKYGAETVRKGVSGLSFMMELSKGQSVFDAGVQGTKTYISFDYDKLKDKVNTFFSKHDNKISRFLTTDVGDWLRAKQKGEKYENPLFANKIDEVNTQKLFKYIDKNFSIDIKTHRALRESYEQLTANIKDQKKAVNSFVSVCNSCGVDISVEELKKNKIVVTRDKYAEPKRDAVKDSQNLKAASENKNIKNPTK